MEFRSLTKRRLINHQRSQYIGYADNRSCRGLPLSMLAAAVLVLLPMLYDGAAVAAQHSVRIDRVKAAFILNVVRFVSWPPDALEQRHDSLLLCLYRSNPLNQAVEMIEGETVAGRRVMVNLIETLEDSGLCNILLIAHDEMRAYIEEAGTGLARPLLTIADLTDADPPSTARHGILVALVRNGKRIGFEINLDRSRQAGLRMSSQLLKLATIVSDDP